MEIDVHSEIGPLQDVLVHCPGTEIERMTQHDLDEMLFDDILAPAETAREHELMTTILRGAGASVRHVDRMLAEALEEAATAAREELVGMVCQQAGMPGLAPILAGWEPRRLAHALISGVYWSELAVRQGGGLGQLRARLGDEHSRFALPPSPNLMFMRDPCVSIYDRVVVGRMATGARAREPLVVAFALRQHGAHISFDGDDAARSDRFHSIEGGDVLVLSPSVLMIGCSMRTSPATIERLVHETLFPAHPDLRRVYVVFIPHGRSVMHLDTILTQIDRRLFLGHAPSIAGLAGSNATSLPVARLERDRPPAEVEGATVLDVLTEELGRDVEFVACGGGDPLHQEREQWTDGANAVAVSPGRIILYSRNRHTIAALLERGFVEVGLSVVHSPAERTDRIRQGMAAQRTVFSFTGGELSRARGGGRCLTMPLRRGAP
jgi:arginine deiminase